MVRTIPLNEEPTGIALAAKPARLLVTCSGAANYVAVMDPGTGEQMARWPAGPGVCSPVVSPEKGLVYVCQRYEATVGVFDLGTGKPVTRIAVIREPVAAALTPDERWLIVANHLPAGPANAKIVAAAVAVIDTTSFTVRTNVLLPNGSVCLRGVAMSPSGAFCAVVHNVARFQVPTTQVENGWMNDSALTLIDLEALSVKGTLLLDEPRRGAANPWAVAWTPDEQTLCVSHSGTHELSVIDPQALLQRLGRFPAGGLIDDLSVLGGIRRRVPLKGNGSRAMAVSGQTAYVTGFFSDSLSVVDLKGEAAVSSLRLTEPRAPDPEREGERLFHDATISHQSWQSCASCHPDGRADGLNWDLLNDGIGNPKNTKSLLLAHRTPPAMSTGARGSAEKAVRSGLRNILFALRPEAEASAIDVYLKGLRPVPSPYLVQEGAGSSNDGRAFGPGTGASRTARHPGGQPVGADDRIGGDAQALRSSGLLRPGTGRGPARGELSPEAQRGQRIFDDPNVGCATCHPAPLFTDLKAHAVGTANRQDRASQRFDTPTLVECWRTAPYLHDGSAVTVGEVLTTANPNDRHGRTSHLTTQQLDDLAAYVLSL